MKLEVEVEVQSGGRGVGRETGETGESESGARSFVSLRGHSWLLGRIRAICAIRGEKRGAIREGLRR